MPTLLTLPQIAEQLGVPVHRVSYAVQSYRIKERQRIGLTRVWFADDVPAIKSAVDRCAANQRGATYAG